jgi:hypothetical protein
MKLTATLKLSLALAATVVALGSVGCSTARTTQSSSSPRLTAAQVRVNPTPRLQSLTRSYEENLNLFARTQDNRFRGIHDDFQMIFFLNRNTGLTEYEYPLR